MKGNAIISSTMLGYKYHRILTCYLHLKQQGSGQVFGGWCLDNRSKKNKKGFREGDRTPSRLAGFWIKRILEIVGVDKWEDLKDKYVRVDGEEYGEIFGIGHITDDRWFYPKKEVEKWIDAKEKND